MSKTQDSYVAWFQKIPKPILLIVLRHRTDGVVQDYEIESGEPSNYLARAYVPPLLSWFVSFYLVRKRKSPLLSDHAAVGDQASP